MINNLPHALWKNFLGHSPEWYKRTIVAFLLLNPVLLVTLGAFGTGWVLIAEFIFTLALALRCYPLQPGGLLAIEAVLPGMTSPEMVYHKVASGQKLSYEGHDHSVDDGLGDLHREDLEQFRAFLRSLLTPAPSPDRSLTTSRWPSTPAPTSPASRHPTLRRPSCFCSPQPWRR